MNEQNIKVSNVGFQNIGIRNSYVIISPGAEPYEGEYEIEPTFEIQTLNTAHKLLTDDVKVLSIRVSETSNEYGTTVYIGKME